MPLAGCGWFERAERPAWRTQAENLCLSRGLVRPSATVAPQPEIDGPSVCGMTHPFKVSALADGTVSVDKAVTIDCPMIPALEGWLADVVQPYAQARFGAPVVGLEAFGAYSCRSVDNIAGAQWSEHAFGNAIDVSGFRLADGREISIVRDWKRSGSPGSRRSCARSTPAPANTSPPCSAPAPTCSITTISTSTWRCTARPTPARAAIAGRSRRRTSCRRRAVPTACRRRPTSRSRWTSPAPACARMSGPLTLRGPSGALPPPLQAYAARPPPPILPAEDGRAIDGEPTSSIPLSRDD